ncbi:MAG: acyltransferase family protein [bacterium]|nr:acyltransferase family protein [bacterium]
MNSEINTRINFFDTLRYLLALSIIIFHASLAYSGHPWWPVAEKTTSTAAEWTMVFLGAFTMSFFFYIAGYFALPVIEKAGTRAFLKRKALKLGIPWFICVLTICPILPFVYHYTRNNFTVPMNYADFWLELHRGALSFNTGTIGSMKQLMETNGFYLRYMWFLSLLLLFFLLFALVYYCTKNRFKKKRDSLSLVKPQRSSALKIIICMGLLTFIISSLLLFLVKAATPGITDMEPLFSLGNIIQFKVTRVFNYAAYFSLGIVTYNRKWIEREIFPGRLLTWAVSLGMLTIAYICLYEQLQLYRDTDRAMPIGISLFALTNFITISAIGFSCSCAAKYNSLININKRLFSVSYELYLVHYPFVILLQLIFFAVPGIPAGIKFLIVSVVSLLCSHAASLYLLKPRPRLAAALAFVLLAGMMLISGY